MPDGYDPDEDAAGDHTSAALPEDVFDLLSPLEWMGEPDFLILNCGHEVPVDPGDLVWYVIDPDTVTPVAVDPRTVH